jgi:Uma2 family endonuclease
MSVAVSRRRFTADDYQRMGQAGILSEDDRVELTDGEVVAMTPIGPRHGACVISADDLLGA